MSAPWVSFCISTYKRPALLAQQLRGLLQQQDPDFEIVISDNDPEGSGETAVLAFHDDRIRYFRNATNLGMVKSFNKSIERATTKYIVMVTDDDPVNPEMLGYFKGLVSAHPGFAIYCGCQRTAAPQGQVSCYSKQDFIFELLDPASTRNLLWSSCVLERQTALDLGGMPDFGSPHLADHAMLALCGRDKGGVIVNRMFSNLAQHDSNFSKSNLDLYYIGCREFIQYMTNAVPLSQLMRNNKNVLKLHLKHWFIATLFALKKYYSRTKKDSQRLEETRQTAHKILALPYMHFVKPLYWRKQFIFSCKKLFW